jgi:carbon storage regulator
MLVLSRKVGERVLIGSSVVVTVAEIQGNRVKLAFDAPNEIPVHREEVYHRLQQEEQERLQRPRPDESPYYAEFA